MSTLTAVRPTPVASPDLLAPLGEVLVRSARVGAGETVLDVAAGTSSAGAAATVRGARVAAWRVDRQETAPFADRSFDVAVAGPGAVLAPDHRRTVDEMVRVTRSGGRLALLGWTPQGFMGQVLTSVQPFLPAGLADGASPALWGDADHVLALLGDRVDRVVRARPALLVDRFATPRELRDHLRHEHEPTAAAYRNVADQPSRVTALDRLLADLARDHMSWGGLLEWDYLLLTARRS